MNPVDHDLRGVPIYSALDLAINRATLPVFYPAKEGDESAHRMDVVAGDAEPRRCQSPD